VNQVQGGGGLGSNGKVSLVRSTVYQSLLHRLARGGEIIGNIAAEFNHDDLVSQNGGTKMGRIEENK
jgi:hypothetical protein